MDCSICFENIDDKNKMSLACNHIYHKDCIEGWINNSLIERDIIKYNIKFTCPYCRKSYVYNKSITKLIWSRVQLFLEMSQDIYLNFIIYYTIIMILLFMKFL